MHRDIVQVGLEQISAPPVQLFPLEKTQKRFTPVGKTYIYDRYILLDTGGALPLFPLRLYAGATYATRENALSPYTDSPSAQKRNSSQQKNLLDQAEKIDYAAAPLCLDASIHAAVLRQMHFTQKTVILPSPLLPEVKAFFSRLRFRVFLPRNREQKVGEPLYDLFESRPDETALNLGELSFRQFTPMLSQQEEQNAHFLMLPSDDAIIASITGRFLLMPA